MSGNTRVILGDHFSEFVEGKIQAGRFETASEAVRAGLGLLEVVETQLDALRDRLAVGKAQADRGETVDGETFRGKMMAKYDKI